MRSPRVSPHLMRATEVLLVEVAGERSRLDTDELFVRWHEHGDRQARAELIERFLPRARNPARAYVGADDPRRAEALLPRLRLVGARSPRHAGARAESRERPARADRPGNEPANCA